ncbi:hypothetical protein AGOR_G00227140 [Albula goreensis]|uniref:Interleukin-2 receptor subunit beta n=1 Tax=Albula goreensis TaxID=1534307 RepID=A0A8T3CLW3_9TELE|nr:hypothetical protein AGOR_G00227140 [Albula goreensis]
MEPAWVGSLLLLSVQAISCHPQPGLTCVNDYMKNLSCIWNSKGRYSGEQCVLTAKDKYGTKHVFALGVKGWGVNYITEYYNVSIRLYPNMTTITCFPFFLACRKDCVLKPLEGQDHNLTGCQLAFEQIAGFYYKLTITVKCNSSSIADELKNYQPAKNIKMHPPGKPVIANLSISWSLADLHSKFIQSYEFQLQLKHSHQLWQNSSTMNLMAMQMSVQLNEDHFEKGREYQARVRVKPSGNELIGEWSNWSPIASWETPIPVNSGLVAAAALLLLLITCRYSRTGRFYAVKLPHVPNPSTYFDALNSVHGGNFQKWVGPLFAPESFNVTRHDDISPVELFKANDITSLLYKDYPSNSGEPWECSEGSSCFSNMGYFYSKCPGSYSIEVCPVYFSYGPEEILPGEGEANEGPELDDFSIETDSSYEQLQDLQGGFPQLDPGCKEGKEDQETGGKEEEEEGEGDNGTGEMISLPPPAILPFSLPSQIPPSTVPVFPHLPSFPQLCLPMCVFDSGTANGCSDISGPLEGAPGRSSSVVIGPSNSGYMSVKEMQNTYCNKSI